MEENSVRFWLTVIVGLILLAVAILSFPGGMALLQTTIDATMFTLRFLFAILVLVILIAGPIVGAVYFRRLIKKIIDEPSGLQEIAIAIVFGLVVGAIWIPLTVLLIAPWNWAYDLLVLISSRQWQVFETPPVYMGLWGFIAFLLGYFFRLNW